MATDGAEPADGVLLSLVRLKRKINGKPGVTEAVHTNFLRRVV